GWRRLPGSAGRQAAAGIRDPAETRRRITSCNGLAGKNNTGRRHRPGRAPDACFYGCMPSESFANRVQRRPALLHHYSSNQEGPMSLIKALGRSATAAAALALAGCGSAPIPLAKNFELTSQHKVRSAGHWELLSRDVVAQTRATLGQVGYGQESPLHVA